MSPASLTKPGFSCGVRKTSSAIENVVRIAKLKRARHGRPDSAEVGGLAKANERRTLSECGGHLEQDDRRLASIIAVTRELRTLVEGIGGQLQAMPPVHRFDAALRIGSPAAYC